MARIQVLPLPTQTVGGMSTTPHILVIDQADPGEFIDGINADLAASTGAKTVLVVEPTLDVA